MKKFLCAVLAICMLCCAGMFVGCKDKGGDSSRPAGSDNLIDPPGGWDEN